jgi:hypothetical protein
VRVVIVDVSGMAAYFTAKSKTYIHKAKPKYNINNDTRICTKYVIVAQHWMWLPGDGFMWTETCWRSFYNFKYFKNLRIL